MSRSEASSRPEAIYVAGLHKSATMFLYRLFKDIAQDFLQYDVISSNNRPPNHHDYDKFVEGPFVYVPKRNFLPLADNIHSRFNVRIFALIRDPRDILVSEYYSVGFTHSASIQSNPATVELRDRIQKGDIDVDRYALMSALEAVPFADERRSLHDKLSGLDALLSHARLQGYDVVVSRYEEMVLAFRDWLEQTLAWAGCPAAFSTLWEKYRSEFDVKSLAKRGKQMAHRRAVIPGDYRTELRPETIAKLDEIFGDFLHRHGYPVTGGKRFTRRLHRLGMRFFNGQSKPVPWLLPPRSSMWQPAPILDALARRIGRVDYRHGARRPRMDDASRA